MSYTYPYCMNDQGNSIQIPHWSGEPLSLIPSNYYQVSESLADGYKDILGTIGANYSLETETNDKLIQADEIY